MLTADGILISAGILASSVIGRGRSSAPFTSLSLPPATTNDGRVSGGSDGPSLQVIVVGDDRWQLSAYFDRDSQGYWFESNRRSSEKRLCWFRDRQFRIKHYYPPLNRAPKLATWADCAVGVSQRRRLIRPSAMRTVRSRHLRSYR